MASGSPETSRAAEFYARQMAHTPRDPRFRWPVIIATIFVAFAVWVGLGVYQAVHLARDIDLPPITDKPDELVPDKHPEIEKHALDLLAAGKQSQAEEFLDNQVQRFPKAVRLAQLLAAEDRQSAQQVMNASREEIRQAQRLFFLLGACKRSRFEKDKAFLALRPVWGMNPDTPSGKCALCILRLDAQNPVLASGKVVDEAFDELRRLVKTYPDDVMFRWMLAVQCRSWKRNAEGAQLYKQILAKWNPGPVLVHQTYANVLDELGRHKEALTERYKAVKLEPAPWSYHGLANTLDALNRKDEASKARETARNLRAGRRTHLTSQVVAPSADDNHDETIEKCKRALAANKRDWRAWFNWGRALNDQGKPREALQKYKKALAIEPKSQLLQGLVRDLEAKLAKETPAVSSAR